MNGQTVLRIGTKLEEGIGSINRKTFCDTFSNRFVSVLQLLTQNEMRFFICFST